MMDKKKRSIGASLKESLRKFLVSIIMPPSFLL